jgi:tetrahydromethanopterin S-methyltransferase subunit G
MAFSLPSNQEKIDTSANRQLTHFELRIFKATTENSLFVLTVTRKESNIKATDPESRKEAYDGIEKGIKESKNLKRFNSISADTMIEKIPGRKITFYTGNDSLDSPLKGYFFLLNDNLYLLLTYRQGIDEAYKAESNRLLRSVHFTATEISEQQFGSKLESRGYKIGYLLGELIGFFVILGVIILVIVLIVRKSSRKKEF